MTFRGILVGLELEYFVVSLDDLAPIRALELLDLDAFGGHVKGEVCAEQLEIATPAFANVAELAVWLHATHVELMRQLGTFGAGLLPVALLDTAPLTIREDARSRMLLETMGPPFGRYAPLVASDQVNLGTADERTAMMVLETVRRALPELVGLAVASPLLRGRSNGVAGNRMPVSDRAATSFPEIVGFPGPLSTLEEHAAAMAALPVFNNENGYYKYIRPMPGRGVAAEVRCLDKQPSLARSLAFAAATLGLLREAIAEGVPAPMESQAELVARFESARRGGVVDPPATRRMLRRASAHLSEEDRIYLTPLRAQVEGAPTPAAKLLRQTAEVGLEEAYRAMTANLTAEVAVLVRPI